MASTLMISAAVPVKYSFVLLPSAMCPESWLQSLFRSAFRLPDEPKCQRCLGLMIFTMLMWAKCSESRPERDSIRFLRTCFALNHRKVLEAAPFEATAMLPLRVCGDSCPCHLGPSVTGLWHLWPCG